MKAATGRHSPRRAVASHAMPAAASVRSARGITPFQGYDRVLSFDDPGFRCAPPWAIESRPFRATDGRNGPNRALFPASILSRRVILDHLERWHHRRFNTVWAFVRFAEAERLGLDFTTPPVRPDPANLKLPAP